MEYPAGAVVAGYTIVRTLGRGGMGTVYLARHPRLPRNVALKMLSPELSRDPEFRGRFEQEAELVAALEHRAIVDVYDRGDHDGQLWIAMQFVPGGDCHEALFRDGPMPAARALHIISEVARGLDYAHSRRLLHRDVKPANILLAPGVGPDEPERVMITDFGIAKAVDDARGLTQTGNIQATFAYAAPERIREDAALTDHRIDVYALGCVFFQLLTNRMAFVGGLGELVEGHTRTPPPRPSDFVPGLPPGFDRVVARAMAKHPGDRFYSCGELAEAARRSMAEAVPRSVLAPSPTPGPGPVYLPPPLSPPGPVEPGPRGGAGVRRDSHPSEPTRLVAPQTAPRASGPPPPGRRRRRRRLWVAVLALLAAGGIGAVVLAAWERQEGSPDIVTASAELPVSAEPLADRTAVAVLEESDGDNLDLYLINTDGGRGVVRLTDSPDTDRAPSLSPDRRTIAYLSGSNDDAQVRVMAADGTGDRLLFAEPPPGCARMGRPGWNPTDGDVMVVTCQNGDRRSLVVLGVDGVRVRSLDIGDLVPFDPSFAHDGGSVLFTGNLGSGGPAGAIYTIDADGQTEPTLVTGSPEGSDSNASWSPDGSAILFRTREETPSAAGNFEIALMDADGSNRRIIGADPAPDSGPAWSPDGTRILFSSERAGAGEAGANHLWLVAADGSTPATQLGNRSGGRFGYVPSWASR